MTKEQERLFNKFGAEVKIENSDGSITIETPDIDEFMIRAYALSPITSYTQRNYKYTVFSNFATSDDIIVVKSVYADLHILLMPDFKIY